MANKNFPTDFAQKAVPATNDTLLIADASAGNAAKYATLGDLPVPSSVTSALASKVDKTTTVNGKALSSNVSLTTDDIAEGVAKYDKVVSLLAGAGIAVTGTYPNFTVANTSPDQVVNLTAGANVVITGTYPNFTIASTGGGGGSSWATAHVTASVNPAVPFTTYFIDATLGAVTITLPNATNSTDEFRIVLQENSHAVSVTTVGGTQLIDGAAIQKITTVGGQLYVRAGGDHYDIITDTRQLMRHVDVTADLDVSVAGYENATVYHCIPSGGTINVTIPDAANSVDGSYCTFTIHGTGSVIVSTLSGQLIEGQSHTVINDGSVQIVCLGDHYAILQDSRAKVQNASVTTYGLTELSTIPNGIGGFYRQSCTSTTDSRYSPTSSIITTGVIGTDTYLGGFVTDAGVIQGTLPEGPALTVVNIARDTGSASFRFYVKFYKRDNAGTETLIGTSSVSNVIDTSTIAEFRVNANIAKTDFTATDRIVRKLYATSAGSPTAKISLEGNVASYSQFSVGAYDIAHNAIAGLQGGNDAERYHLTAAQATVVANTSGVNTGDQDLSGLVPKTRTLTINGTTYDLSADRSWTISAGGGGGPSSILSYSQGGTVVSGTINGFVMRRAGTLNTFGIDVSVLPTGSNLTVDLKKNGTSVLSAPLSITTTESATNGVYSVKTGDAGKATIATSAYSAGDVYSLVIVAGSTSPGYNLNVEAIGTNS